MLKEFTGLFSVGYWRERVGRQACRFVFSLILFILVRFGGYGGKLDVNCYRGNWMSTEPILTKCRELESDEKIRLVQDLWDEIADEVSRLPLSEVQRRLLDERIADEEQNPDDVEPWSVAKGEILKDL